MTRDVCAYCDRGAFMRIATLVEKVRVRQHGAPDYFATRVLAAEGRCLRHLAGNGPLSRNDRNAAEASRRRRETT